MLTFHLLVVVVQNVAVPVCLINVLNASENASKVASLVASSACVLVAVVASSKFRNIFLKLFLEFPYKYCWASPIHIMS